MWAAHIHVHVLLVGVGGALVTGLENFMSEEK